jgi:hypothetical protein
MSIVRDSTRVSSPMCYFFGTPGNGISNAQTVWVVIWI